MHRPTQPYQPRKVQNDGSKAQAWLDWGRAGIHGTFLRKTNIPCSGTEWGLEHFILFVVLVIYTSHLERFVGW